MTGSSGIVETLLRDFFGIGKIKVGKRGLMESLLYGSRSN